MEKHRAAIILAGGKGSRMNMPAINKVCAPVGDQPAITRLVSTLRESGFDIIVIVVGHNAESVMKLVSIDFPGVIFAYQSEQHGTGHAARVGIATLKNFSPNLPVLITAGDKVIQARAIAKLVENFDKNGADLSFLVAPKDRWSDAGRIFVQDGRIVGSFEKVDLARGIIQDYVRKVSDSDPLFPRDIKRRLLGLVNSESKAKLILPALWDLPEQPLTIKTRNALADTIPAWASLPGLDAQQIETSAEYVNISLYLGTLESLEWSLGQLTPNNAQQEEYLTDIVHLVASSGKYKVSMVPVDDANDVLGYNTPKELLEIAETLRVKPPDLALRKIKKNLRTLAEWQSHFQGLLKKGDDTALKLIYGTDLEFVQEKVQAISVLLHSFQQKFGNRDEVFLVRAPGRINLMGRHVDHQGGRVNVIAIPREVIFAVSPRQDYSFHVINVNEENFPERIIKGEELLASVGWDKWLEFINCTDVNREIRLAGGDWGNYLKAAILRLQNKFRHGILRGADIAVLGNIPMAAGLSSSSALVVGMVEIVSAINNLPLEAPEVVDLCGEGEWFVGTRGGSSDHAAIKLSQRGQIAQFRFLPFKLETFLPFFPGATLLVANTGIKAEKSKGARTIFNSRVFCYEVGKNVYKQKNPRFAPAIQHLRDINPGVLNISLEEFYESLKKVPEFLDEGVLNDHFPQDAISELKARFGFQRIEKWLLRAILLYGIAECDRSVKFKEIALKGDENAAGRLMNISHDGDRIVTWDNGRAVPYEWRASDDYLTHLIDLIKNNPGIIPETAQLCNQPGNYGCSIGEIDFLVDACRQFPRVFGAQLSGAGLGGCMMALVQKAQFDALRVHLRAIFSRQFNRELEVFEARSLPGAGYLSL